MPADTTPAWPHHFKPSAVRDLGIAASQEGAGPLSPTVVTTLILILMIASSVSIGLVLGISLMLDREYDRSRQDDRVP